MTRMGAFFWEKTSSHHLVPCAFGVDSQTFRDAGGFGRKQTAISAYVASLRRQAAITPKCRILEKRSEHPTHLRSFGNAHNECADEE